MPVQGRPLNERKTQNFEPKWDESLKWYKFPENKLVAVRVIGAFFSIAQHWIKTTSKKTFPTLCTKYNSSEERWIDDWGCPCHDDQSMRASQSIVFNAIIRELQEAGNPNPIMAVRLPQSVQAQLDSILEIMKCDPAHPEKGYEIFIRNMPNNAGNMKWDIKQGERIPLTEEELGYTVYDLANIIPDFSDPKVRSKHAKNMKEAMIRQMYYVVQVAKPQAGQNPWKAFKGDPNGQSWLDFPELVQYEQTLGKEGRLANTGVGWQQQDSRPAVVEDDPLPESFNKPIPIQPPESKPEAVAEAPAEMAPVDAKMATVAKPVEAAEKPDCFTQWKGNQKCLKCPEKKACIQASSTDEDD